MNQGKAAYGFRLMGHKLESSLGMLVFPEKDFKLWSCFPEKISVMLESDSEMC